MPVTLVGPLDNRYVQRVLMVGAYAGITLKVTPIREGVDNTTESFRLNCNPLQRVPVLKTAEGYLFESNAMVRYLARAEVMVLDITKETEGDASQHRHVPHPDYPIQYAMYGHSVVESGEVDSWLDFAAIRLDAVLEQVELLKASGQAAAVNEVRELLFANLEGLDKRIEFLRDVRKLLVSQGGGKLTARGANAMFLEDELYGYDDGDDLGKFGGRPSTVRDRDRRISSVYNVASSIRTRQNEVEKDEKDRQMSEIRRHTQLLDENVTDATPRSSRHVRPSMQLESARQGNASPRQSAVLMSARGSILHTGRGSVTGDGQNVGKKELFFLVGESLTAADLIVALALHSIYASPAGLKADAQHRFPNCYKFYKSILMLPVATDMRKALKVSLL